MGRKPKEKKDEKITPKIKQRVKTVEVTPPSGIHVKCKSEGCTIPAVKEGRCGKCARDLGL